MIIHSRGYNHAAWHGDSGGPMMVIRNNRWVQIGVFSTIGKHMVLGERITLLANSMFFLKMYCNRFNIFFRSSRKSLISLWLDWGNHQPWNYLLKRILLPGLLTFKFDTGAPGFLTKNKNSNRIRLNYKFYLYFKRQVLLLFNFVVTRLGFRAEFVEDRGLKHPSLSKIIMSQF